MALILALLFIVLMTVIVVEFAYETQVAVSFASNQDSDFEAHLAARSAVAQCMALLAEDLVDTEETGEPEFDSELDPVNWYAGVPFKPLNEAIMRGTIRDEFGKLNLNALFDHSQQPPVEREWMVNALREFFLLRDVDGQFAPPEAIVDAILDWLDYEDGEEVRPDGAENEYYTALENPYPCKNGPMDSIEELLLIRGISPELYFGDPEMEQLPLSEYLTVHGDWSGRINANTALPETIAAAVAGYGGQGADFGLAEEIYEQARVEPFRNPTELDVYLEGITPPTQQLDPVNDADEGETAAEAAQQGDSLSAAETLFSVNSAVFRIYGDGMLEDVMVRIEAFVWRTPLDVGWFEFAVPGDVVAASEGNQDTFGGGNPIPGEPFRVLGWRVIR